MSRRFWLVALSTIVIALAGASTASAGAAYFRPVAADIVKRLKGWRVWSVPLSAVPDKNAFLRTVIPFLRRVR